MQSLVARIHPSIRCALMGWFLTRSILWLLNDQLYHQREPLLATGSPLPGLVAIATETLAGLFSQGPWVVAIEAMPWIIVEVMILWAGIEVYRFARSTELPQVSERACWIWFLNPLLAYHFMDWGSQIAAASGALALALLLRRRPLVAAMMAVIAVGCRLEFILLWPAVLGASWRIYGTKGEKLRGLLLGWMTIPAAFAVWIGATWHLAGMAEISLRALHGDAQWRHLSGMHLSLPGEAILYLALTGCLLLVIHGLRRYPLWYSLAAIPVIAWPLIQTPAYGAALSLAWALPLTIYIAHTCEDQSVHRSVLGALFFAYFLVAMISP